jgi:AcrR family transcriptional regulator
MTTKRRTQARKQPRQERAQASVDAILTAALRLLEKDGLDKLTTAKVADVAGVSIGTLYQYFPSKEAIIGALLERRFDQMTTMLSALLDATRTIPLETAIGMAVRAFVEQHLLGAKLHVPFLESYGTTGRMTQYRAYMDRFVDLLAGHLEQRHAQIQTTDYQMAAFILVSCAEGIAQSLAYREPDRAHAERLVREATAIVTRYLGKPE